MGIYFCNRYVFRLKTKITDGVHDFMSLALVRRSFHMMIVKSSQKCWLFHSSFICFHIKKNNSIIFNVDGWREGVWRLFYSGVRTRKYFFILNCM